MNDFDGENSTSSSSNSASESEGEDCDMVHQQQQQCKRQDKEHKAEEKDNHLPGVCFPILDLLTVPLHQHNKHKLVSGGKKGKGTRLSLQVLGNPLNPEVLAEDSMTHPSKTLYIYLKETYPAWFDEV